MIENHLARIVWHIRGWSGMSIRKYGFYWTVIDTYGRLVCLCVYRKGAEEVVRRLTGTMTIAGHQKPPIVLS